MTLIIVSPFPVQPHSQENLIKHIVVATLPFAFYVHLFAKLHILIFVYCFEAVGIVVVFRLFLRFMSDANSSY